MSVTDDYDGRGDDELLGKRASGRGRTNLVLEDEAHALGFSPSEVALLKRLYKPHLEELKNEN